VKLCSSTSSKYEADSYLKYMYGSSDSSVDYCQPYSGCNTVVEGVGSFSETTRMVEEKIQIDARV